MEKQRLLNVYVNNLTMMESVNRIHDMIREKQTSYVVEVNVDVVMKMEKDPYLKKISEEADLTLVGEIGTGYRQGGSDRFDALFYRSG